MFMLVLMFMPPTIAPGFSGVLTLVNPVVRLMNANLPTAVVTTPLTADQRGVFKDARSR
jgi:hypothetical protein